MPETLVPALEQLEKAYRSLNSDPDFWAETFNQAGEWDKLIEEFNHRTGLV